MELLQVLSVILSGNLIISVLINMKRFISSGKLLHKMKEVYGAISHMMDELIVVRH